jgi:hypothetical protein
MIDIDGAITKASVSNPPVLTVRLLFLNNYKNNFTLYGGDSIIGKDS